MQVKLDITLTDGEVVDQLNGKVEDIDLSDKTVKSTLVNSLLEDIGLDTANGGWTVKVSEPKADGKKTGQVKIVATLIPNGAVVLG